MNHFCKSITVVLSVLLISACAGKGQLADDETVAQEAFKLPTSADYEVPEDADYNIDITLRSDLIDNKLIMLDSLPSVVFTVWGFDELVADVSASEISSSEFPLRPQSVPYPLRFSASDFEAIEFQTGQSEAMKFYVTFGIDVDGDGSVCNGDFRQDYNVSRPERFPVTLSNVSQAIEIIEVSGEICAQ